MYFDSTMILLIPAMILAFYAQSKVSSAYSRYSSVRNRSGITGAEAARRILDSNGLHQVPIEMTSGRLSDHYDPRKRVMRLPLKCIKEQVWQLSALQPTNPAMPCSMLVIMRPWSFATPSLRW